MIGLVAILAYQVRPLGRDIIKIVKEMAVDKKAEDNEEIGKGIRMNIEY